jgi:hypothetical protein
VRLADIRREEFRAATTRELPLMARLQAALRAKPEFRTSGCTLTGHSGLARRGGVRRRAPALDHRSGNIFLSDKSYFVMRGITIKLPETTLQALAAEARASGRSIAAVVRSRLDTPRAAGEGAGDSSVYALAGDLVGVLAGSRRSATNERRKFRRP